MEAEQESESRVEEILSAAILVLNWNGRSLLQTCLPPLLDQTYSNYEVVVVDNGSTDDSAAFVTEQFPQVRLIQNEENLGFSRGMNAGLRQLDHDVVVLLNNDVRVQSDWLAELLEPFKTSLQIGIVGCKLLYPDGTIQHLGAKLTYPLAHSQHFYHREADIDDLPAMQDAPYVTGAAMAIHRSVFNKIGLLDEMFYPFYYEETDYCYQARDAGFRVIVATGAVAIHDESFSVNKMQDLKLKMFQRNRYRFVLKHYSIKQFLDDFVPAETIYLANNHLFEDVDAIRLACLQQAVAVPTILPPNSTPEQITAVQEALLSLRNAAIMSKASRELPPDMLNEFVFPETGTLGQSLIAKFRTIWSNIAAKWLVRSLQQQQSHHNRFLQRQIRFLSIQARTQSLEIEQLMAALLPAQQTQKRLEANLAMLQKQVENLTVKSKQS
ncbi:MAG: glycosyltransferase family 2 protein [Chloroflexi bacterium]|nr:glycosyltransferase family 2 protein [Chloroflexota bacterium]